MTMTMTMRLTRLSSVTGRIAVPVPVPVHVLVGQAAPSHNHSHRRLCFQVRCFSGSNDNNNNKPPQSAPSSSSSSSDATSLVNRNMPKVLAITGGSFALYGMSKMMWMVTGSLMALTPGQSLYYGFIGGAASAAFGSAAMWFSGLTAQGVSPDRAYYLALNLLNKHPDVQKILGTGTLTGGQLKAYSSRGGYLTVKHGSVQWIKAEVELTFAVKGSKLDGIATVLASRNYRGQAVDHLSVVVLNDARTYLRVVGDESTDTRLHNKEHIEQFVKFHTRKDVL